jgi:hypothetical protein
MNVYWYVVCYCGAVLALVVGFALVLSAISFIFTDLFDTRRANARVIKAERERDRALSLAESMGSARLTLWEVEAWNALHIREPEHLAGAVAGLRDHIRRLQLAEESL